MFVAAEATATPGQSWFRVEVGNLAGRVEDKRKRPIFNQTDDKLKLA